MKLLVPINQRGSIAAGTEAPHSTEVYDFPVEQIPAEIRPLIAEQYDPVTGTLADKTPQGKHVTGVPRVIRPVTDEKVRDYLSAYARACRTK